MITLDKNWTLKAKLGEAGTDVDFIVCYKIPRYGSKPDAGKTRADSEEVATSVSAGTTEITLVSPPPQDERRRCQVFICNKGASAHTIYLFIENGSTERYILSGYSLAGNTTISVAEDGSVSVTPTPDHGQLAGLADDDHAQYALLAGRGGGQTLYGSTATNQQLLLRGNSFDANGGLVNLRRVFLADNSADPSAVGDLNRNNTGHASLLYHDGTAVRRITTMANTAPSTLSVPYFDGTIHTPSTALAAGKCLGYRGSVVGGFFPTQVLTKTDNYTLTQDDYGALVLMNVSTTGKAATLPNPTVGQGWWCVVKKINSSTTNTVGVARNGSETIDGRSSNDVLTAQYSFATYVTDGTNWHVLACWDHVAATASGVAVGASDTFVNVASVTVPPGRWNCTGLIGSSFSVVTGLQYFTGYLSQYSANTTTDAATGNNLLGGATPTTSSAPSISLADWVVEFTSSLTTLYAKAKFGVHTSSHTGTFNGRSSAIRIG